MIIDETVTQDTIELQELDSTFLHNFVLENNFDGLQEILSQQCIDVDKRNEDKQTALHVACQYGNVEGVSLLLENGANVLARDVNEFTPFLTACHSGFLGCAKQVFTPLINVDQTDKNGWSSLVWAVYKGHSDVVEFLLNESANVHTSVAYNMTSLLWAAGRGFSNIVELLCVNGANVNHVDKYGNTALIWASKRGYTEIIECLLQFGADPNIVGTNGCSSLINAVKGNYKDAVKALLQNPKVNVNQADQDGHTPLGVSTKVGCVETTKMLLEHGAYLNLADHHGDTPLIKAVKYHHLEVVKILLSHFVDVEVKGKEGKTALHLACESGHVGIIRALLNCGSNIECTNSNHETPLMGAVKEGNVQVTKVLLSNGADVSAQDEDCDTCVHVSIRSQNTQLVELLLQNPKNGRFLYQENKLGETPYDIDMKSSKKILLQLFGSKGYSTAAICHDSTLDTSSCSLAEMLTEPMLEAPICIGLYAKWGSDVSVLLSKIKYQISLFTSSLPFLEKRLPWMTSLIIFYLSLVTALLFAFIFQDHVLAAVLSFFLLFLPAIVILFLIYYGAGVGKWAWAVSAHKHYEKYAQYMKLLLQICFVGNRQVPSTGKVRFIFVECMNISTFSEEDLLPNITATLLQTVEDSVGWVGFRLARSLSADGMRNGKKFRFRKVCCIPTFVILILFILALSALIIMIVTMFGPSRIVTSQSDRFNMSVAIYIITILLACVLLLSSNKLWEMFSSLIQSPRRILKSITGDVERNKAELKKILSTLSEVDSITRNRTRVCLLINGLETNDQHQSIQLLQAVRLVYATDPVIVVVCLDYHLVLQAVQHSSVCFINASDLRCNDYLQQVIQLPVFLPDKKRKKQLFESGGPLDSESDMADGHELSRRKRYPKHFDVTKWLTSVDCFQPVNPVLIKRVASIISFTARLLRSASKDFSWTCLSSWIVLTELWSYSTTCMVCYVSNKSIARNRTLKSLYLEMKQLLSNHHHPSDARDQQSLQSFIASKSCVLTVADVTVFYQHTVNLDPSLETLIPTYNETWAVQSSSMHGSTVISTASNSSYDDVALSDWTVDDVWSRIKSIPGLDAGNFHNYETFVRRNNFHGLALSLCDVDELKKELKTSFGDWCLIKKFIRETKKNSVKHKNDSLSSVALREDKSIDTGTHCNYVEGVDDHIALLSKSDRVAYDKAFKEYLKLQPQTLAAEHNDTHNVVAHSQLDNERFPLLNELDINANP